MQMQYIITSVQIAEAVSYGHEPAYGLPPETVQNALVEHEANRYGYYPAVTTYADPAMQYAQQDHFRLVELAELLDSYTAGGALVVVTPDGARHRITEITVLEDRIVLKGLGHNFKPDYLLPFVTYHQLLAAVIGGASR